MLEQTVIWLMFIFSLSGKLASQEPSYLHYDVSDGLPSATVYSIEQDSRGFMWFGTDKGLARFDGVRFKVFNKLDGLPDPEVLNIFQDNSQKLWLTCFGKKLCYKKNELFIDSDIDPLLGKVDMLSGTYDFLQDAQGQMWIINGRNKVCRVTSSEVKCYQTNKGITNIFSVGTDIYFVSAFYIYHFEDDSINIVKTNPEPYKYTLGSIFAGFNGEYLLLSYNEGLLVYKYYNKKFIEEQRLPPLLGKIFVDSKNNFWICSPGIGAVRLQFNTNGSVKKEILLNNKMISHAFEDNEGTIWFSTLNEGVFALTQDAPISYSNLTNDIFKSNYFSTIELLKDGRIVVGDDSGNIYFFKNNKWQIKHLHSNFTYNRIRQISESSDNELYIVTDKILYKQGKVVNSKETINMQGAPKSLILRNSECWVGGSSGLVKWNKDMENYQRVLNKRVTVIAVDHEKNLWAGGLDGLCSEKDGFKTNWGEEFMPIQDRIVDIKIADKNSLWVATSNYGLLKAYVSNGVVENVKVLNDDLSYTINNIRFIFNKNDQEVWLATNNGIFSLQNDKIVTHYTKKDGLANDDVNAVLVHNDTIWGATSSGISVIRLKNPSDEPEFPSNISSLSYQSRKEEKVIDLLDKSTDNYQVTIPAGATQILLNLSALHFQSRGNFYFECIRNESLLPAKWLTWRNIIQNIYFETTGKTDTTLIHNAEWKLGFGTPPGRFNLRVIAVLPNGIRSKRPGQITLTVPPHWYQTIWFSLALAALGLFLVWRYIKTTLAVRQLESTASELQLQAIKAQINPHFVGNSINAIQQFFYPPDPLKASQYISIFSDLLRRTISLSEKKFIPIKEELDYIQDYLEMIRLRFGNRFVYSLTGIENISPVLPFPSMILQPLIENATIHGFSETGISELQIDLVHDGKLLTCTITDNGIGIYNSKERKKALGIKRDSKGLALLDKKIQTLNRLYNIEMKLEFKELSEKINGASGTQATLSFLPGKVDKSYLELP